MAFWWYQIFSILETWRQECSNLFLEHEKWPLVTFRKNKNKPSRFSPSTSTSSYKKVTKCPDLLGNMSVIDRDYGYNEYVSAIKDFDVQEIPFKIIKSYSEISSGPAHGKYISAIKGEPFLWPSNTQESRRLASSLENGSQDLSIHHNQ